MNKKVIAVLGTAAVLLANAACTKAETKPEASTELTESGAVVYTTAPGGTTVKPFVDAQTQIMTPTTTQRTTNPNIPTTERETAVLVGEAKSTWPTDNLVNGLPKPNLKKLKASYEYRTAHGKRLIIRFDNFSYSDYLSYIDKVESAGFSDNNNRYHIPDQTPKGTAMFYFSFDGSRSFGIYWHGEDTLSNFDCEIVICDYDQAQAGEIQ